MERDLFTRNLVYLYVVRMTSAWVRMTLFIVQGLVITEAAVPECDD